MPQINILIAVIHDKKFNLRLQTLNNVINNQIISKFDSGYKIIIIDRYNHDDMTMDDIRNSVKLESPQSGTVYDSIVKSLHVKHISQAMKHKLALENFIAQNTFDTMLVIEDDVLCSDNVSQDLVNAINHLNTNKDIDMLLLGCPTPKQVPIGPTMQSVKVLDCFRLIPTCDAYLIKKENAKKILDTFLPIRYQLTTQLSFLASVKNINIHMCAPNIFVNGSKYGVYVSSIDPNNKLFLNPDYNKLALMLTQQSYTSQEYEMVEKMTKEVALREHPDFQTAFGNFFMRLGNYQLAKEFYDNAYKIYVQNDCILNNECEFMTNYTKIFGFFQEDRDAIHKELDTLV
jgi:GR25 family glycosyltransferase involved in LPS biosynthesis